MQFQPCSTYRCDRRQRRSLTTWCRFRQARVAASRRQRSRTHSRTAHQTRTAARHRSGAGRRQTERQKSSQSRKRRSCLPRCMRCSCLRRCWRSSGCSCTCRTDSLLLCRSRHPWAAGRSRQSRSCRRRRRHAPSIGCTCTRSCRPPSSWRQRCGRTLLGCRRCSGPSLARRRRRSCSSASPLQSSTCHCGRTSRGSGCRCCRVAHPQVGLCRSRTAPWR